MKSTRKIKVLRIIARLNIGGPALHTILLSEGLDKNRFETVLVCGLPDKSEGDMTYLADKKKISPLVISELGRGLSAYKDTVAFWKLLYLIKREKPDIIHTHTAKAGTLGRLAGMCYNLFSGKQRCVLIHTFHGHVLHSYFNRIKSAFFVWIEKILAIFTNKIVAISEKLKQELIGFKIANSEKIVIIPLGLELQRYLDIDDRSSVDRDYKTVGIIGRLVPVKNHKMFLDAVKEIKDIGKSREKVKFFIVGDGFLRGELENYARKLGVSEDVSFTSWVKDLVDIYRDLDIVTVSSLNEGTPLALIEAQAAACPCVATKVGGVADVIEEGRSGFLVPSQDTKAFSQAIIKLLNNPQMMRQMGAYGRSKAKDRFSSTRLISDTEKLYDQVFKRKEVL